MSRATNMDMTVLLPCSVDLFEKISVGIVTTDPNGRITLANPTFCAMTGHPPEEVIGRLLPSFLAEPPSEWTSGPLPAEWHSEVSGLRKDGSGFTAWLHLGTVAGIGDDSGQRVAVFNELTALRTAETQLAFHIAHDSLTGLPARELGCDAYQGYLCSRPVPASEIAPLLRRYGVES